MPAAPRLLVAGETFEDLIFAGLPRLPRPGEEIRTDEFRRTFGGGALISAAWARAEGLDVSLLSALPPRVGRILHTEGIAYRNLRRPKEPHAITACLSFRKERSFATFNGVNPRLEERVHGAVGEALRETLPNTPRRGGSARPFGALLLAWPPRNCQAWADLRPALAQMRLPTEVFWDFGFDDGLPDRDAFDTLLAGVTGVFVNAQEAALYDGPRGLLRRAAERGTLVIVKRGAEGAEVFGQPETRVPAPIPLRGLRDTTGAGDAFAAGFLARRLGGGSLAEQLTAGNVCGARSVQRLGGLPARPWAPEAG